MRASGDLESTFGNGGKVTTELSSSLDQINSIVIQPDGKIVAGGESWDKTDSRPRFTLARYNKDGKLDTTFGRGGIVQMRIVGDETDYSHVDAIVLQPDGKMVVAGQAVVDEEDILNFDFALLHYEVGSDSPPPRW